MSGSNLFLYLHERDRVTIRRLEFTTISSCALRLVEAVVVSWFSSRVNSGANSQTRPLIASAVGLFRKSVLNVSSRSFEMTEFAGVSSNGSETDRRVSEMEYSKVAVSLEKAFFPVANSCSIHPRTRYRLSC